MFYLEIGTYYFKSITRFTPEDIFFARQSRYKAIAIFQYMSLNSMRHCIACDLSDIFVIIILHFLINKYWQPFPKENCGRYFRFEECMHIAIIMSHMFHLQEILVSVIHCIVPNLNIRALIQWVVLCSWLIGFTYNNMHTLVKQKRRGTSKWKMPREIFLLQCSISSYSSYTCFSARYVHVSQLPHCIIS